MAFAKISQVAHYVPEQVVTNHDLAQIMDTSDEWISSRTGIKQRHISKTESTSDLATEVAKSLLAKGSLTADQIDFIIVATITPDSMMPSTAARVQANIGAHRAFAFDLTAACSGFVFALSTAEKFLSSGQFKKGLLSGLKPYPRQLIGQIVRQLFSLEMELVGFSWKRAKHGTSLWKVSIQMALGASV